MKISNDLIPIAYEISRNVFERKMSFGEGKLQLVGQNRINPNSAADYIRNFHHMMNGIRFTRTLNAFSMNYYFEHIYQDYGIIKLSNALGALRLHIEYYEALENVKMHKMRDIYEKYIDIPILTPDEQEQNEIISQEENRTKEEIRRDLLNLKPTDSKQITIHNKTFKRDNKTIAQIKILRNFTCQICSTTIIKKDGSLYIEAAHIIPKHIQGRETPDNILLLCPNHHKEFDLGNLEIKTHNNNSFTFILNGKEYSIDLSF